MVGAIPSPYRDIQTLTKVRRRKRTEKERLLDGELPTSNVYFTQFEQTDHQERGIIERIVERNVLLDEIYEIVELDKENRPWPKSKALKALIALRKATLAVIMAIRSWRVSVGDRPFLHRGENYLMLVRDDMDVLQDIDPVRHFGFFLGSRNPFVLPLRPLHLTRRQKSRGEKKLLSLAEEELAREFATVSQVDKENFLVCHEYLVEEENGNVKKKRGARERKWGYDQWVGGMAWAPPPKPPPRRATRRTLMTTWIANDGLHEADPRQLPELLAARFKEKRASMAAGGDAARERLSKTSLASHDPGKALSLLSGQGKSFTDVVLRKVMFEDQINAIHDDKTEIKKRLESNKLWTETEIAETSTTSATRSSTTGDDATIPTSSHVPGKKTYEISGTASGPVLHTRIAPGGLGSPHSRSRSAKAADQALAVASRAGSSARGK